MHPVPRLFVEIEALRSRVFDRDNFLVIQFFLGLVFLRLRGFVFGLRIFRLHLHNALRNELGPMRNPDNLCL